MSELKPVSSMASREGALRWLSSQFRLFARDSAKQFDNLKTMVPNAANEFSAMADVWNQAADIVDEMLEPKTTMPSHNGHKTGAVLESSALVRRLLHLMAMSAEGMTSLDDAAVYAITGNGPVEIGRLSHEPK